MRWFCTQPDIVEDAHNIRYHTKSSAGAVGSFLSPSSRGPSTKAKRAPASYNGTVSDSGARLRTAGSTASHGGKKSFGSDGHGAALVGISGPIPIEPSAPAKMNFLHSSPPPMIVATHNTGPPVHMEDMQRDKSKSLDIPNAGMVTDSEREGLPKQLRRKSRRMSAPFAALGIHVGSGTDTDTTMKRRRVSKVMIGAPEGFKHESHVGMGGGFASSPEVPDSWNVEAWRAEIERTLTPGTTPQSMSRPKGPRPTSSSPSPITPPEMTYPPTAASGPHGGTPPRNRYRRSVDGAAPRRSVDGYGGSSGAMTDAPMRPMTAPNRARSGSGGGGSQHRRSRSGSQTQTQVDHGGAMSANEQSTGSGRMRGMEHGHSASLGYANSGHYGHSQSHGLGHSYSHSQPHPHPHGREHGHGHTLGKDSITSLASIPTSTTTSTAHTTLITPNTTSTSLNRSLSDKPHYPTHYPSHYSHGHYQQQHQQYHQHLAHLGQSHSSYYHNGPGQPGTGNGSVILQRSSSATAALPPSSTSSSATVASMTSTASSATAYGGGVGYAGSISGASGRKPIPAQRRKPVPQHLPATAEVSPFPTLLVVGNGGGSGPDKRGSFPFDVNVKGERPREREALADRGVDVGERQAVGATGTDAGMAPPVPTKVPKELVPLLGVPGDEAHYVTKSTKARWDGAMAEIASALRDPTAEAPPV